MNYIQTIGDFSAGNKPFRCFLGIYFFHPETYQLRPRIAELHEWKIHMVGEFDVEYRRMRIIRYHSQLISRGSSTINHLIHPWKALLVYIHPNKYKVKKSIWRMEMFTKLVQVHLVDLGHGDRGLPFFCQNNNTNTKKNSCRFEDAAHGQPKPRISPWSARLLQHIPIAHFALQSGSSQPWPAMLKREISPAEIPILSAELTRFVH